MMEAFWGIVVYKLEAKYNRLGDIEAIKERSLLT